MDGRIKYLTCPTRSEIQEGILSADIFLISCNGLCLSGSENDVLVPHFPNIVYKEVIKGKGRPIVMASCIVFFYGCLCVKVSKHKAKSLIFILSACEGGDV